MGKLLQKILSILDRKQLRDLVILQILLSLVSLLEVLGVASIAPFMAVASHPQSITENAWLHRAYVALGFSSTNQFLMALGVLSLCLIVSINILTLGTRWFLTRYGLRVGRVLGARLFENYLRKDYLFHTTTNSSLLIKNVFQEVVRISNNIFVEFLLLNSKAFTVAFIAIGLVAVNYKVSLLAASAVLVCYGMSYLMIKRRLIQNGAKLSALEVKAIQTVTESLGGIKEVKLSGKEDLYVSAHSEIQGRYEKALLFNAIVPYYPRYIIETIAMGGIVLVMLVEIGRGHTITDLLPMLSLFALAGIRLIPALQQIFSSIAVIRANSYVFLQLHPELVPAMEESAAPRVTRTSGSLKLERAIRFENVSFRYPGASENVFSGFSLDIPAGSYCAVVGPSGSGKSTLIDLLLGLLAPQQGRVTVDGREISSGENCRKWQNAIGYVPQSVYLLDNSFAANIAFTINPNEIDMAKVRAAASMALLDEVIESRPEKYEAFVGERGVQLSGGQRQRVAIARALYHDPEVLVFDEATGALDSASENELMESINALAKRKTVILITHRLSMTRRCSPIFLMKRGKIAASGTYSELAQKDEEFRQSSTLANQLALESAIKKRESK